MRVAYVGFADEEGLRMLVPETSHAGCFLAERARRSDAVCFWAVLDRSIYLGIQDELSRGASRAGMDLLNSYADELGTILPSTYEPIDSAFFAA